MKKMLVAVMMVLMFVSIAEAKAQKSAPKLNMSRVGILIEGSAPVQISWSLTDPDFNWAEVEVLGKNASYGIYSGPSMKGILYLTPRVVQDRTETNILRVTWKGPGGETNKSLTFRVHLPNPEPRSVEITSPTPFSVFLGQNHFPLTWTAKNLPADARVSILAYPDGGDAAPILLGTEYASYGFFTVLMNPTPVPVAGWYDLRVAYTIPEYGIYSTSGWVRVYLDPFHVGP
jgi:hypothetical protein